MSAKEKFRRCKRMGSSHHKNRIELNTINVALDHGLLLPKGIGSQINMLQMASCKARRVLGWVLWCLLKNSLFVFGGE